MPKPISCEHGSHPGSCLARSPLAPDEVPATTTRRGGLDHGRLGWPHGVVVGCSRDRPLARLIVGTFGLVLGASTGLFLGGMLGVLLAMALLPFVPDIAVTLLAVTTLTCTSAGAVLGARVLQRETFDEFV